MNGIKCLVTGANGFLGSVVTQELARQNIPLKAAVRQASNRVENLNEVVVGCIDGATNWVEALEDVDVIIHTAGRAHVIKDSSLSPLAEYREVNTYGTLNLAKQAISAGVKRFIFISTIKVNGESTLLGRPFTASDAPNPVDPYSVSKYEAEQELLTLAKGGSMDVVIIRPPLIYGEGVKANFAALLVATKRGFPLPFRAIKHNRRSLVSAYNLTDLIINCLSHKNASNQIFLVSDYHDISTSELVALMAKANGCMNFSVPVPVFVFELLGRLFNKGEMIDRLTGSLQVDISKTKKMLDWFPRYSLDEGLRKSIVDKGAT